MYKQLLVDFTYRDLLPGKHCELLLNTVHTPPLFTLYLYPPPSPTLGYIGNLLNTEHTAALFTLYLYPPTPTYSRIFSELVKYSTHATIIYSVFISPDPHLLKDI